MDTEVAILHIVGYEPPMHLRHIYVNGTRVFYENALSDQRQVGPDLGFDLGIALRVTPIEVRLDRDEYDAYRKDGGRAGELEHARSTKWENKGGYSRLEVIG